MYWVTSPILLIAKCGYWTGSLADLYTRYITYYGRDVDIIVFLCKAETVRDCENEIFQGMSPFHIHLEHFRKSDACLAAFLAYASHIASHDSCSRKQRAPIKITLQMKETRQRLLKDAVQKDEESHKYMQVMFGETTLSDTRGKLRPMDNKFEKAMSQILTNLRDKQVFYASLDHLDRNIENLQILYCKLKNNENLRRIFVNIYRDLFPRKYDRYLRCSTLAHDERDEEIFMNGRVLKTLLGIQDVTACTSGVTVTWEHLASSQKELETSTSFLFRSLPIRDTRAMKQKVASQRRQHVLVCLAKTCSRILSTMYGLKFGPGKRHQKQIKNTSIVTFDYPLILDQNEDVTKVLRVLGYIGS